MKAIQFPARAEVSLVDLAEPLPAADEVLLAVRAAGICHTDLDVLHANYGTSAFPLIACHEFAGEIVAIGSAVQGFKVGDRVVVDPNLECGHCPACQRGWAHLCEGLEAYGVTVDGGFAEYCAVKATHVYDIADLPFDVAALAEPMGCVLNGIDAAYRAHMQSALIFGAGPMGMLLAIALRTRGLERVMLVDVDPSRRALAETLGFEALAVDSESLAALHRSVDLVSDATGVSAVAARLTDYVANGGTAHFFGVCPQQDRIELSPFEVFRRQLTLVGTHSLNHNIPEALLAIRDFGAGLERLISHRLPMQGLAAVLGGEKPDHSLKVQLALT